MSAFASLTTFLWSRLVYIVMILNRSEIDTCNHLPASNYRWYTICDQIAGIFTNEILKHTPVVEFTEVQLQWQKFWQPTAVQQPQVLLLIIIVFINLVWYAFKSNAFRHDSCLSAVTMADIKELQEQIKHLMKLIQKLTTEFRAVRAELEALRVDWQYLWNFKQHFRSEHINLHTYF